MTEHAISNSVVGQTLFSRQPMLFTSELRAAFRTLRRQAWRTDGAHAPPMRAASPSGIMPRELLAAWPIQLTEM
ncbi:hypothetical protein [Neomesorhizobium albiziae]|uniref:hypothetical protein n=1 Tax=Neomesorhizobium albiziae TaxID=335020 RepID=UPI00122C1CEB|nr:hypothetical protein [Mesorhizobium albiziae]